MKLSQTSFISFLLSTILLFYAMNKIHILILSVITFTCFSCQKQNPKTQLEEIAINFCESFYNFNYPVAEEHKEDVQRLTPEEMNRRRTGTQREKKPEQIEVEQHIQQERIEQRKERQMNQRRQQQQRRQTR